MKNIIKGFLLSVAAITLFASCAQENFSAPEGKSMVFTATIAQNATRTALDASADVAKVNWVAGDEITINGVVYVATPDETDAAKATFTKKNGSDADPSPVNGKYYAAYGCSFDAAKGEGELAAEQVYAEGSLANAPMYAESTTTALSFKNICGLLEICIKGNDSVESIRVSSDNLGMCGAFTVSDGQTAIVSDAVARKVTLATDGVNLSSAGVKFYVAVPAGEYEGLEIAIKTTDGKSWFKKATGKAAVAPSTIYALEFSPVFSSDIARYSNDGGASWKSASSLAAAITSATGTTSQPAQVELLNDNALGSAKLPDISGKVLVIKGHGFTWDISKRTKEMATNAKSDITFEDIVIDGNSVQNGYRFIYNSGKVTLGNGVEVANTIFKNPSTGACGVIYNYIGANLDINGAYIHDCSSVSTGACSGGFIANYGGHIDMEAGLVENLKCVGSGTSVRGAFFYSTYMTDAAKTIGTATITGGTFKNCEAPYGGLIYSYSGTTSIENATISGCTATGGGALFVYSYNATQPSTITLKNCTFDGCSASSYAGAINVSASTAKVTVDGCTFKGCSSTSGASLYVTAGTLNVNGSTIENKDRDAVYVGNGGTITLTDCDINYSGDNYAVRAIGTSDGNKKGVVNVNDSRINSEANGVYSTYATANVQNSEITCNGTYGNYILTGGIMNFTDASVVNWKRDGYVFYSGTGNSSSKLTVNSGFYYCPGHITGWYTTSGSNNRMYILGGRYNINDFNGKTQYGEGVTVKADKMTHYHGGSDFTYNYVATK